MIDAAVFNAIKPALTTATARRFLLPVDEDDDPDRLEFTRNQGYSLHPRREGMATAECRFSAFWREVLRVLTADNTGFMYMSI